mgnify:CR=1 FL=1
MLSFLEYLSTVGTEFVDESQIDRLYDKAKLSVKLVQLYDQLTNQKLLTNISTIATINSNVYGLYNSAENKKVIGPNVVNKIRMKFGDDVLQNNQLNHIPNIVIKKYLPEIDLNQIKPSDTIHINIAKHLATHGDSLEAVLEIASSIIHEATHELELQTFGKTSEVGPVNAEKKFMMWTHNNWKTIITKIPQLANMTHSIAIK